MTIKNSGRRWATPLLVLLAILAALAILTYLRQQRAQDSSAAALDVDTSATSPAVPPRAPDGDPGNVRRSQMTPVAQQAIAGIVAARTGQQGEGSRRNATARSAAAAAYAAETADPSWAAAKEAELQGVLGGAGMAAAGVEAGDLRMDCKRTMCRMEASFPDSGAADDWVLAYMSSVGNALQKSVVSRSQNADGSVAIVILSKAR